MSETTPTYPRLPLSEVPGYTPDGPVMVEWRKRIMLMRPGEIACNRQPAIILDPTGAASLARAVAARVGLDVSGGVRWWDDGPSLAMDGGGDVAVWAHGHRLPEYALPALRDATDTLSALAIVARAVLT